MVKGLIFDLDGVIVDTARYHYQAWKKIADELGIEFTEAHNENLKGVSRVDSLEYILSIGNQDISDSLKEHYLSKKNQEYLDFIAGMTRTELLPGALQLLETSKEKGLKIALGSASKNARRILSVLGLTDIFTAIVDGTITTKSKPDPEVFLLASDQLGLPPSSCIVFEDSISGVQAAKTAGFYCVGIGDSEILSQADEVHPHLQAYYENRFTQDLSVFSLL